MTKEEIEREAQALFTLYDPAQVPASELVKLVQKCAAKSERFRFVSDDDGHSYLIPADKRQAFNEWLEHQGKLWGGPHTDEEFKALEESYKGEDFNDYLCDGPHRYTFERPEVEK